MARNIVKEKAWAREKYGPELRAQLVSREQYDRFKQYLETKGVSFASWLQKKVAEELDSKQQ